MHSLKYMTLFLWIVISPSFLMAEDSSASESSQIFEADTQVMINQDGLVLLDGIEVSLKQLSDFMNNHPDGEDAVIVVIADEEAEAQVVIKVMDICCNYKTKVKLIYTPSWNHKS